MLRISKSNFVSILALFVLLFCLVGSNSVFAKSFANRTSDIGLSGGMWLSGDIEIAEIEGEDLKKDNSLLFKAIADGYVVPKFAIGGYIGYSKMSLYTTHFGYTVDTDATMVEYGGALKGRFLMNPRLAIKPGISLGYRSISLDESGTTSDLDSDGLALNLHCEIQFNAGQFIFYIEPGFLTQPIGGNEYTEITFAPIWYILGGVCF